jgi:phage terminase small subunit
MQTKAAAIAPHSAKAWTREKRAIFFDALAATSNVTASAKAAGLPEASAYRLRRQSAEFRAAWKAALCEGYAKLEHMMLERAMRAFGRRAEPDAAQSRMEEYSNKLAMSLLAAHRASAKGEREATAPVPRPKKGSAKSRIEARFTEMRERIGSDS